MIGKNKRKRSGENSKSTLSKRIKETVDSATVESFSKEFTNTQASSREALISWLLKSKSSSQVNAGLQCLCTHFDTKVVHDGDLNQQLLGWMTALLKILEFPADDHQFTLCCNALNVLLLNTLSSTEFRKDSLQSNAFKILQLVLDKSEKVVAGNYQEHSLISLIFMVKTCIKYLGASCLSIMNKMDSFFIRLFLNNQTLTSQLLELCFATYSYLPRCGGVAIRPENYSKYITRLLTAAEYCTANLLYTCCHIGADLKLPDVNLPLEKPGGSVASLKKCHQQLSVYVGCLNHLLTNVAKTGVTQIAVRRLIQLVCKLTSIGVNSRVLKKSTGEMKLFKDILPQMIKDSLQLLSTMFKIIGGDMMLYKQTISQLLIELVQDCNGAQKTGNDVINSSLYKLMMSIFSQPACISVLYNKQLIELLLGLLLNHKTACNESLLVVERILLNCGKAMNSAAIQAVFSWLTAAGMNMKKIGDSELRYLYYRCIKSSLHCSNRIDAPLTHIAVKLLSAGINDDSDKVRCLCLESLHSDSMLSIQPVYPSLHQHPFVESCEERLEKQATDTNIQSTAVLNSTKTEIKTEHVGVQVNITPISDSNVVSDFQIKHSVVQPSVSSEEEEDSDDEDGREEKPDEIVEDMHTEITEKNKDESGEPINEINSKNTNSSENSTSNQLEPSKCMSSSTTEVKLLKSDSELKRSVEKSADVAAMLNDFVNEESDQDNP